MVDHNIFVRVKALHLCNHAFGVLFLCIMLLVVDIVNEVEDGLGQINGDFNNLGWIEQSARYPAHSGSCNCKYLRYLFAAPSYQNLLRNGCWSRYHSRRAKKKRNCGVETHTGNV